MKINKYLELHNWYKNIIRDGHSEPISKEIINEFSKDVQYCKASNEISNHQFKKLNEDIDKLLKYENEIVPDKTKRNVIITTVTASAISLAIMVGSNVAGYSLVSGLKNKPENRGYAIEKPTDEQPTKNDFNNNPTEPETEEEKEDKEVPEGYNFKADDLDSLKAQATKLAQQLIDNGYLEVNTDADKQEFARKVFDFLIVKNIESILNYKNLASLDQDLSLNFAKMYDNYIEIEQAIAMLNIMAQSEDEIIDASTFEQKTADSELINELSALILEYNNSKTKEEQQVAFDKLVEFKNEFIGNMTTNDLNYSATTIHMILKTLLHLDESTKADGYILITDVENHIALFNSKEVKCPNLVVDSDNEEYKNAASGANQAGEGGYSNAENTKFKNSLKYALDKLEAYCVAINAIIDAKGEAFEEEYSYENIIKDMAYNIVNINNIIVKNFNKFINDKIYARWEEQDKEDEKAGNNLPSDAETFTDDDGVICVLPRPTEPGTQGETKPEGPTLVDGSLIAAFEVEGVFIEANLTQERYDELENFYLKNKDALLTLGYNGSSYDSYKTNDPSKNLILKACYDKGVKQKQEYIKNNVQPESKVVGNKENGNYIPVESQEVKTSHGEPENVTVASTEAQTQQSTTVAPTTVPTKDNVISESEFESISDNDDYFWLPDGGIPVEIGTSYDEIVNETVPFAEEKGKTR